MLSWLNGSLTSDSQLIFFVNCNCIIGQKQDSILCWWWLLHQSTRLGNVPPGKSLWYLSCAPNGMFCKSWCSCSCTRPCSDIFWKPDQSLPRIDCSPGKVHAPALACKSHRTILCWGLCSYLFIETDQMYRDSSNWTAAAYRIVGHLSTACRCQATESCDEELKD